MTGRDGGAVLSPIEPSPVVILVRPQLADNIGAVARCMANGGLFHLRLVAPRDGWPQERAWRLASGADAILDAATVHDTVDDAVADLQRVFATCPRPRHVAIRVLTARAAAEEVRAVEARGLRTGILFGPERAGLDAEDLARADTLVRYPLNPAFDSLNLAQAVMVMAYEWWTAAEVTPAVQMVTHGTRVASKGDLEHFLVHLVDQLDACGFLRNAPKRPGMVRNIRHLFQRGEVTEQELRTLHGVVAGLALGRRRLGRFEEEQGEAAAEMLGERRPSVTLTAAEQRFLDETASMGSTVTVIAKAGHRTADFMIDGVPVELKTVSGIRNTTAEGLSAAIANRIVNGLGQSGTVVVDARDQAGMTIEIAERALARALGADGARRRLQSATILTAVGTALFRRYA